MELIFRKDVQMKKLDAEQHRRLDHGESLLQPLPTGHHSQMHGGRTSAFYIPAIRREEPEEGKYTETYYKHFL